MNTEEDSEMQMIRAAIEIGSIAELNGPSSLSLDSYLKRNGKVFAEMTIREAIEAVEAWRTMRTELYRSCGL